MTYQTLKCPDPADTNNVSFCRTLHPPRHSVPYCLTTVLQCQDDLLEFGTSTGMCAGVYSRCVCECRCQLSAQPIPRIAKDGEFTQEASVLLQHFLPGQEEGQACLGNAERC